MPSLVFSFPNRLVDSSGSRRVPDRAVIRQVTGNQIMVILPFGPQDVRYGPPTLSYVEIERPGRAPLLEASGRRLRKISFSARIANAATGGNSSVQDMLDGLYQIARDDTDVEFWYGVEWIPWRMRVTSLEVTVLRRALNGEALQADIEIEMTESVALDQRVIQMKPITYTPTVTNKTSTKKRSRSAPKTPKDDQTFTPSSKDWTYRYLNQPSPS